MKSIKLVEPKHIWHMKKHSPLTRYSNPCLTCAVAITCICKCTLGSHKQKTKPSASDEAVTLMLFVRSTFTCRLSSFAFFFTFPDDDTQIYAASHVINTFSTLPAFDIPKHFRRFQPRHEAALRRRVRALSRAASDLVRVHRQGLDELHVIPVLSLCCVCKFCQSHGGFCPDTVVVLAEKGCVYWHRQQSFV